MQPARILVRLLAPGRHTFSHVDPSGWLSSEERERLARVQPGAEAASFRAARVLLRWALSRAASDASFDTHPASWRIVAADGGKPQLAPRGNSLGLRFNVSHTRGLVAVAVARGVEVGIDTEAESRAVSDALGLARRFFSPEEAAALAAIPDPDTRQRQFIQVWAAKEAFVKATGRGLSAQLPHFTVDLAAGRYRLDTSLGPSGRWHLRRWRHEHHTVALAWDGASGTARQPVDCRVVSWSGLEEGFHESRRQPEVA